MTQVFVYGTLLSGEERGELIPRAGGELLRTASVPGTLHDLGMYPALVLGSTGSVEGEVWRCPIETLALLDSYEGVGEGLFVRVSVEVEEGRAWTYVAGPALVTRTDAAPVLLGGRWRDRHREREARELSRPRRRGP